MNTEHLAILKHGVEKWNLWRTAQPEITPILLSADLSFAKLFSANLSGASLICANLSGAKLNHAKLFSANLSGANLSGADLQDANISGANLSGADLSGADLSDADLQGANISGAILSGAIFMGAILSEADLSGAELEGANISGANLSGAVLSGANLSHMELCCSELSHANLSGANLQGANLRGADLRRANLSGANLQVANLRGADLRHANLSEANLQGVDLGGTDLDGTDLDGTDLDDTDLDDTDLDQANFSGANLFRTKFSQADLQGRLQREIEASVMREAVSRMSPHPEEAETLAQYLPVFEKIPDSRVRDFAEGRLMLHLRGREIARLLFFPKRSLNTGEINAWIEANLGLKKIGKNHEIKIFRKLLVRSAVGRHPRLFTANKYICDAVRILKKRGDISGAALQPYSTAETVRRGRPMRSRGAAERLPPLWEPEHKVGTREGFSPTGSGGEKPTHSSTMGHALDAAPGCSGSQPRYLTNTFRDFGRGLERCNSQYL